VIKQDPISDNYSFYMFHLKDKKARAKSDLVVDPEYQTKSQKEIVMKTRQDQYLEHVDNRRLANSRGRRFSGPDNKMWMPHIVPL